MLNLIGKLSKFSIVNKVVYCLNQGNKALLFVVTKKTGFILGVKQMHPINDTCLDTVNKFGDLRVKVLSALGDNYMYIIVDEKSQNAAVVDPVDPKKVVDYVKNENLNLTKVLTTHHHWDHAGGNKELVHLLTNPIEVYGGDDRVDAVTKIVSHNDKIQIGDLSVKCIFTPCHTSGSICYFIENKPYNVVFTGDTLFIGGCGRFFEGTSDQMYEALVKKLGSLPKDTRVFCGHEYTCSNLKFGLHVEPNNEKITKKLNWAHKLIEEKKPTVPSTIAEEFETNPFMRVNEESVKRFSEVHNPVDVMGILRDLKNKF